MIKVGPELWVPIHNSENFPDSFTVYSVLFNELKEYTKLSGFAFPQSYYLTLHTKSSIIFENFITIGYVLY